MISFFRSSRSASWENLQEDVRHHLRQQMLGSTDGTDLLPHTQPYITKERLKRIWVEENDFLERLGRLLSLDRNATSFAKDNLLQTLSASLWINSEPVFKEYLKKELITHSERDQRTDNALPFKRGTLTSLFSAQGPVDDFLEAQYRFCPLELHEMPQDVDAQSISFHRSSRLPFEYSNPPVRCEDVSTLRDRNLEFRAVHGSYLVRRDGQKRKGLIEMAIKYFRPAANAMYHAERGNLRILRAAEREHENINTCFTAFEIGDRDSFGYVLSDWAISDVQKMFFGEGPTHTAGTFKFTPLGLLIEFQCVVDAIKWLHEGFQTNQDTWAGLHLDIKPENILVFQNGANGVGRWKINDFDRSFFCPRTRQRGKSMEPIRIEADYLRPDTYSAPEIELSRGEHRITTASDIWSLACIFAEMLGFIRGGKTSVLDLQRRRKIDCDEHPTSFYYAPQRRPKVKPQVQQWIREEVHSLQVDTIWGIKILEFLEVDQEKRLTASRMHHSIDDLIHNFKRKNLSNECVWPNNESDNLENHAHQSNGSAGGSSSSPPSSIQNYALLLHQHNQVLDESSRLIKDFPYDIEDSRLSADGLWALFRTKEDACAIRLQSSSLWERERPVIKYHSLMNRGEGCLLLDMDDHYVEAVDAAGDVVAALFCGVSEPASKRVQICRGEGYGKVTFDCEANAYDIAVSKRGQCLLLLSDNTLRLGTTTGSWTNLDLEGESIRATSFSQDGRHIYAWSRGSGNDYWRAWTISDEGRGHALQPPWSCVAPFTTRPASGRCDYVLLPISSGSSRGSARPLFMTLDHAGRGTILSGNQGELKATMFSLTIRQRISKGCVTPDGRSVFLIRREQTRAKFKFSTFQLPDKLKRQCTPEPKSQELRTSLMQSYMPCESDVILTQEGQHLYAYVAGIKSRKTATIRRARLLDMS